MRNVCRDVVEARIDRNRDRGYEHEHQANYEPPRLSA
jgi:hypothetical protein